LIENQPQCNLGLVLLHMRKLIQIFFPFCLISLCHLVIAQGGWKKRYYLQNSLSSICRNVIETPNGNFIMIGLTYDPGGFNYLTLVGTDPQGNTLWRKDYGSIKFEYLDNILAPNGAIVRDQNCFYHTLGVRVEKPMNLTIPDRFNLTTLTESN
jgi:hypothetical protein